tara:strand:+ start:101 stop:427 length:327 start_codon:yes stop_codon:yes gene_type:complete
MNVTKKINIMMRKHFFICSIFYLNFIYSETTTKPTSNSKANTIISEEINEKNKSNNDTKSSEDNFHEIMSTKNGCAASCCSGDNVAQQVNRSKKQKNKKRFSWFNRSK